MASSHSGLKRIYNRFNRLYFNSELPPIQVVWEPCGEASGVTHIYNAEARKLTIDPALKGFRRLVKIIMLHEMIHVKFPRSNHGKTFKNELQRLWDAGAFETLI